MHPAVTTQEAARCIIAAAALVRGLAVADYLNNRCTERGGSRSRSGESTQFPSLPARPTHPLQDTYSITLNGISTASDFLERVADGAVLEDVAMQVFKELKHHEYSNGVTVGLDHASQSMRWHK